MFKKIILALYILYLPFQLKLPQIPVVSTLNVFIFFLLMIFLFARASGSGAKKIDIPLLLFLLIWSVSFLHTFFYPEGMWRYVVAVDFKRLISLALGYFVFSRCIKTKKEFYFLFYTVLVSLIFVGLDTWKGGVLAGPHFADFKRSSGPFAEDWQGSDIAGGFLAIFTPFLIASFFFTRQKIARFICFLGTGICVMGLLATYSRGSILALAIAATLMVLYSIKHLFKTSKITAFIVLLVFLGLAFAWERWVPESIINRVQGTTVQNDDSGEAELDQSSQMRFGKWGGGLEIFSSNPLFGVGFRIPQYILGSDMHNSFIQIAAEMGIFGFLLFLVLLFNIFTLARSLLKTEFTLLGLGFIGCVVTFIIVNLFYSNFFRDTVAGTFWIMLGLLVASKRFVPNDKSISPKNMINSIR